MKCVEESHNKRVYQEPLKDLSFGYFCLHPLSVAFIPLSASTLLWLHQGDRHFTCFRVAQSAVNCEVFFQPLLPLPSDDYTLQGCERGWNQNRNRDR
jgi:hypothetical protein